MFVRNKCVLTLNHCFWPKYESIILNNASSSEKVHLLLSSHIKIHWHVCLELLWTDFACKWCLICAYFSPDSDKMNFSLEKAVLWIDDSYFSRKQLFEVKIFTLHLHLADAFIQSDLHCIQVTFFFYILSALAFPGNRTHDLGVASAMLYYLSYRKALMMDLFLTNAPLFTPHDVNWWTGVVWITCGLL